MKVLVTYDKYNTSIEEASIPLTDGSFSFKVDGTTELGKKLVLSAVDSSGLETLKLEMTQDEARQFNTLFAQMVKQTL